MQEVRTGIRASLASAANRPALDGRVIKVKLAGEVQRFRIGLNGAVCEAVSAMRAIRAIIQSGFSLTDADASTMMCRYLDDEGDMCTLNRLTLQDWTQQYPHGPLKLHVSLSAQDPAAPTSARKVPRQRSGRKHQTAPATLAWQSPQDAGTETVLPVPLLPCLSSLRPSRKSCEHLAVLARSSDVDISRQSANALCDAAHLGCPEATAALVPLTRADDSHIVRISRDTLLAVSSSAGEAEALASQETETSDEHPVNSSRASDPVSNDVDPESRTRLQRLNNSQHVDVNDDVGSVTLSDATGCDLPACFLSTSVWDLCDQTNDVVEEVKDQPVETVSASPSMTSSPRRSVSNAPLATLSCVQAYRQVPAPACSPNHTWVRSRSRASLPTLRTSMSPTAPSPRISLDRTSSVMAVMASSSLYTGNTALEPLNDPSLAQQYHVRHWRR